MESFPVETTSWVTNQATENVSKLKSDEASFKSTVLWDYKSGTENKQTHNLNRAQKKIVEE